MTVVHLEDTLIVFHGLSQVSSFLTPASHNDFDKKKRPENLRGGALCHKLTIHKQFSIHKFINFYLVNKKHEKKKWKKPDRQDFLASLKSSE